MLTPFLSILLVMAQGGGDRFAVWPYGADLGLRDGLIRAGRMHDDLGGWLIGAPDPALAARANLAPLELELEAGELLLVVVAHAHAPGQDNPLESAGRAVWTAPGGRLTLRAAPKAALDATNTPLFRCHGAGRVIASTSAITPRAPFRAPGGASGGAAAVNPDPDVQAWVAQVSQANLQADVQTMVNFGTRRHEQPGEVACENWLEAEFAALGLGVSTFNYDAGADVVIGEKLGAKDPSKIVVIGGHYDSINFATTSGPAPGADDDASGVAAVLEIARILAPHDFDYTIRFCGWSGEEYGLLGSEAYAAHLDGLNADVIGMVQLDMIAYRAAGDVRSVDFVTNDTDPGLTAFSKDVFAAYVPSIVVNSGVLSAGTSDHRSFFQHGFPACFPFEDLSQYSPHIHTANDVIGTSANDWTRAEWITEGALATVAELARPASLALAHVGLGDTQDEVGPYVVDATIVPLGGTTVASADLTWRVDGGAWNVAPMAFVAGNLWRATIPGQVAPTRVEYHLSAVGANGREAWLPEGFTPGAENYSFLVGTLTSLYVNGFEGVTDEGWTHAQVATQDDWQRGTPQGQAGDPNAAATGAKCWANDLGNSGWNGEYAANAHNYLRSPAVDCSGRTGVRLRLQRWLTIEEGVYDDAKIEINGQVVWQNPLNGDLLDNQWTEMDLDVSQWADGNPAVQVTFRLQADGGLQYGGWNVDDFELYVLTGGGGTGTNSIVLSGPTAPSAGSSATWTFTGAPAGAPWWLLNGASAGGMTHQGHAFDVGPPVMVLLSGTTSGTGTGSATLALPAAAAGRTGHLEIAALSAGAWKDSNLLVVQIQ